MNPLNADRRKADFGVPCSLVGSQHSRPRPHGPGGNGSEQQSCKKQAGCNRLIVVIELNRINGCTILFPDGGSEKGKLRRPAPARRIPVQLPAVPRGVAGTTVVIDQRLSRRSRGEEVQYFEDITCYDARHSTCCISASSAHFFARRVQDKLGAIDRSL
jgi:hypothetical protein